MSYSYTLYANNKVIATGSNSFSRVPSSVTLYTQKMTGGTSVTSSTYANWTYWAGHYDGNKINGILYPAAIHSGLVASNLVDGIPQFTASYASKLFDNRALSGKTIYSNVGVPFVYSDGYYTFDSDVHGAYFANGAASNTNLALADGPILMHNGGSSAGGDWYTGFMPFNTTATISSYSTTYYTIDGSRHSMSNAQKVDGNYNYYYSMNVPVNFSMTSNGRVDESDNSSEAITFDFSGDDDVWVFIDGKLVLDMGGIHDAVSGTINFADNTVTYKAANTKEQSSTSYKRFAADVTTKTTASKDASLSQTQLFNEGNSKGVLNTDRTTFAATDNHVLRVVYMERGDGLSNCKIKFNLPQKDYVSVSKSIDPYLYEKNGETETKTNETISDDLMSTLQNRNFDFVLYENDKPLAGATYSIYNEKGAFVGNASTSSEGRFSLKIGQTARFYNVKFDGQTRYKVTEDDLGSAYGTPAWSADSSNGSGYTTDAKSKTNNSDVVDVLPFTFTNKLLTPVADIVEDTVVIDYGLPDLIDVLANDSYSATGDTLTITGLNAGGTAFANNVDGRYGTFTIQNNKVLYTPTQQVTGLDTVTYQLSVGGTVVGTAKLTVVPATSMYYEENFGLVSYGGAAWEQVGPAANTYQEEGRVGNTNDSPYGSDVAYLDDDKDSNGTSKQVDTTNRAASFSYTFTGTGTTFFARTSNNSGYMRVVIKDADGNTVYTAYRDTKYKTDDNTFTMYNIPVFTWNAENYGTYQVEVSIAEKVGKFGTAFNLDGIRVYNPIDPDGTGLDVTTAKNAYAADGEANCTVATLRDKLISDDMVDKGNGLVWADEKGFVIFTDTNDKITEASEYVSNGPKEEVYLNEGQSVTFSLAGWDPNTNKIYLGMKAPAGEATVSVNGHSVTLHNAADCYYDISYAHDITEIDGKKIATFTVKSTSGLVSVTNIKVTGNTKFAICRPKDENIDGSEGEDVDPNE